MKYDIEFHFDPSQPYNRQELIARLAEAGVNLNEDEHYAPDPHISYCGYCLFLSNSDQAIADCRWIFGRAPRDEVRLRKYVDLARMLGGTLCDLQEQVEITKSTIQRVLEGMERFANTLSKLFGTVKKDDETIT